MWFIHSTVNYANEIQSRFLLFRWEEEDNFSLPTLSETIPIKSSDGMIGKGPGQGSVRLRTEEDEHYPKGISSRGSRQGDFNLIKR